jgi:hypothetical protein
LWSRRSSGSCSTTRQHTVDVETSGVDTQAIASTWCQYGSACERGCAQETANYDVVGAGGHTTTCVATYEGVVGTNSVGATSTLTKESIVGTSGVGETSTVANEGIIGTSGRVATSIST